MLLLQITFLVGLTVENDGILVGAKVADSVLLSKKSIFGRRVFKSFTLRCLRSYRVFDSKRSCWITRLVVVLVA